MKEGDLITTYYAGYFILDRIERRFKTENDEKYNFFTDLKVGDEYSPLFYFTQVCDSNGNLKKSKQKACDASFCNSARKSIKEEIEVLKQKIKNLENIVKL